MPRRPANHPEQHHHQQPTNKPREQKALSLISHPTSPTLHRQPIFHRHMVSVDPQRSVQQGNQQQKEKHKREALPPTALRQTLNNVSHPCGHSKRKQQNKLQNAPSFSQKMQRSPRPKE